MEFGPILEIVSGIPYQQFIREKLFEPLGMTGSRLGLPDNLQQSNALKGMLSLLINFVAVVYFAAFGPVEWLPALVMAGGALSGGYLGVGLARRLGKKWLRLAVIAYGLTVAIVLFVR